MMMMRDCLGHESGTSVSETVSRWFSVLMTHRVDMSLKMLLQMSLFVLPMIQTSSSQPAYEIIRAQDEIDSCAHSEKLHGELLTAMSQLKKDIAEMKAMMLQHLGPLEGPIDTTPEPETTPEPTTPEPKPGEKQTCILYVLSLSMVCTVCWSYDILSHFAQLETHWASKWAKC